MRRLSRIAVIVSAVRKFDIPHTLDATADESLDKLTHLVGNLLDMSRLQAGALSLFPRPSGLDEIVSRALDHLDQAGRGITVDIPESLPEISVDPAILERKAAA